MPFFVGGWPHFGPVVVPKGRADPRGCLLASMLSVSSFISATAASSARTRTPVPQLVLLDQLLRLPHHVPLTVIIPRRSLRPLHILLHELIQAPSWEMGVIVQGWH